MGIRQNPLAGGALRFRAFFPHLVSEEAQILRERPNMETPEAQHVKLVRQAHGHIRRLNFEEVVRLYAPLRMAVLGDELQRTKPCVHAADDLLDRHDWTSKSFGCFVGRQLVGAVRLVVVRSPEQLPASPLVDGRFSRWCPGGFGEVSRLIVRQEYRRLRIGTQLVAFSLQSAVRSGIGNVVVTAAASAKSVAHYAAFGFRVVRAEFDCEDSLVFSPCPMAVFHLDVFERERVLRCTLETDEKEPCPRDTEFSDRDPADCEIFAKSAPIIVPANWRGGVR